MPKRRVPSYRHHKPSGQAVVTLNGQDFYLGPWQSQVSRDEYDRLIGEWLANGRRLPAPVESVDITVTELVAGYWAFAQSYYVKDGQPSGQLPGIKVTLRMVREVYGRTPARNFGPLALKALQERMIGLDLSRRYINDNCERIKRMFKWGAAQELIPVQVHQGLTTVPGLKRGRTQAREADPIFPVDEADFQAALGQLSPVVGAMVQVQMLTGCRPCEVCMIRPCDIDRTGAVWCYVPKTHKTEYRNRERRIYIGPRAKQIVSPWLVRGHDEHCFSPKESARAERACSVAMDSPADRARQPRTSRRGDSYTTSSYRRAIVRACERAGIPRWTPNQLRHSRATELRRKYGLEAVQTVLGHAQADVTQIYAERDFERAKRIMREVG